VPERPSLSALSLRGTFRTYRSDRQRLSGMPQEEMEGIFVCHSLPFPRMPLAPHWDQDQRSVGFLRRFRRHERNS